MWKELTLELFCVFNNLFWSILTGRSTLWRIGRFTVFTLSLCDSGQRAILHHAILMVIALLNKNILSVQRLLIVDHVNDACFVFLIWSLLLVLLKSVYALESFVMFIVVLMSLTRGWFSTDATMRKFIFCINLFPDQFVLDFTFFWSLWRFIVINFIGHALIAENRWKCVITLDVGMMTGLLWFGFNFGLRILLGRWLSPCLSVRLAFNKWY
jgi:hypothetical protein